MKHYQFYCSSSWLVYSTLGLHQGACPSPRSGSCSEHPHCGLSGQSLVVGRVHSGSVYQSLVKSAESAELQMDPPFPEVFAGPSKNFWLLTSDPAFQWEYLGLILDMVLILDMALSKILLSQDYLLPLCCCAWMLQSQNYPVHFTMSQCCLLIFILNACN